MIKTFIKFFNFCGEKNRNKFYKSIVLGVIKAIFEAMKIPAISVAMHGVINKNITDSHILLSFGIMVISIIGNILISCKSTMLQTEAGYSTCANKRIEIAEHLKYLPMGYFNKNSLGYITSVATNTMEQLSSIATRVVMLTTEGFLVTGIIAIMICCFDIRIGITAIAGIAVYIIITTLMQKKAPSVAHIKDESDRRLVEKVLEYIHGIAEVKAYNLTGEKSKALNEAIDDNAGINTKMEFTFIPYIALQGAVTKLTGIVISGLSILFYISGSMTMLETIIMIISSFILFSSLEIGGSFTSLLKNVDIAADKAQNILDLPTIDIDGKNINPPNFDMDLNNIEFSYDKRKIIDNISIHIPEKTTTAIVGPSGGGKTTLCHLISRFWDVDSGSVKLGGIDVREYSMDSLMKNFSFVFQNVYLFSDTIANNIRFGHPEAPMEEVIKAARKACCHEFIMSLPDGYDTVIGEGGTSLSGGEKQRISIARAIMKDAPIIILDEATANVDPENEKELTEAVKALTKEKTILMIAHRLKTVRNADNILVIDGGRIVQQGTHSELMKQNGIYKRFVDSRELAIGWKV